MKEILYESTKIEFTESANPRIVIDGELIPISWDADAEVFSTAELPYRSFGSVEEVAKAVVDRRRSQAQKDGVANDED